MSKHPRDVEALLKEYKNLINAIYRDVAGQLSDKVKQDDLRGYIIYEFILLVKEYDPQFGVDFPYYIKKSLTLRTRHSYLSSVHKDEEREIRASGSEMINEAPYKRVADSFSRTYEPNLIFDELASNELEQKVLDLMLSGIYKRSDIIAELPDYSNQDIILAIGKIKERLRKRAKKYNMLKE